MFHRECPSAPTPQFWCGGRGGSHFRHGHGGHHSQEGGKTTNVTLNFFSFLILFSLLYIFSFSEYFIFYSFIVSASLKSLYILIQIQDLILDVRFLLLVACIPLTWSE